MPTIKFKKKQSFITKEQYAKKRNEEVTQTFKNDRCIVDEIMKDVYSETPNNIPKQNLAASFEKLINKIDNCT